MKKITRFAALTFWAAVVLFGAPAVFAGGPGGFDMASAQSLGFPPDNTIHVRGLGSVEVAPDTATVSFELQSKGKTAKAAIAENKKKVAKLKAGLLSAGLPEDSMSDAHTYMYSDPVYESTPSEPTGFMATKSMRVSLGSEDDLGDAADKLVELGAARIDSIYTDPPEITFALEGKGKTVKIASSAVNDQLNKMKDALAVFGVSKKKAYAVNSYYVDKSYDSGDLETVEPQKYTYSATHTFFMKVSMAQVDTMLDAAFESGAERLNQINYTVADLKAIQKRARMLAMADAREKGVELSELTGLKVGRVKSVSTSPYYGPSPMVFDSYSMGMAEKPGLMKIEVELEVLFDAQPSSAAAKK